MKHMSLRPLVLAAMFAVLTAVGAFLRIPAGISSISLQIFFTAMAGFLLGPAWGAASQSIYVALGLLGLPIFAGGGGLGYIVQPTFGFLLGLIPMAWITGLLARQKNSSFFVAGLVGLVFLYAIGLPWLWMALKGAWSAGETLLYGCLMFLPADFGKLLCAAWLAKRILPRISNIV